jgi:hypothetical protein
MIKKFAVITKLSEKNVSEWFARQRCMLAQQKQLEQKEKPFDSRRNSAKLEKVFQVYPHLTELQISQLSKKLQMNTFDIERWFFYRRIKQNKESQ